MKKKILTLVLCIVCAIVVFAACGEPHPKEEGNVVSLPVADANPAITHPEGKFFESGDTLYAQGGLSVMGKGFLKIMIDGKEWEFVISDEVQHKIDIFNKDKDNLKIMRGTMLQLTYEKKDLIFIATDIEIIQAN